MVGRSYSLDTRRVESTDLRIALYEMQEDVQRLEEELEAEREATATSASETMSLIQRLQGEKAMLAMEASQYKRMSEERMSHAEMSLELLEELNYQKEVEIKNLECELHSYKCKLMSLGCSGTDRSQTPSPEPPIDTDLVEKGVINEQSLDLSRRQDQEKIKKLDEQLKELMDFRDTYKNLQQETCSVSKKSSKRKRGRSVIKRDDASCSGNDAEYQAELQRLKERVDRLERERCNVKQEEEIISVQTEIKSEGTTQKLLASDDSALVAVQEAMLYFWL